MTYDKIYISKSEICSGLGIFSNETIEEDKIITWYYGKIKDNIVDDNEYIIDYDTDDGVKLLVGITDIDEINRNIDINYGKGLAQFANDAISFLITKKHNNSHFIQKDNYIFLISEKKIMKNEEILASYGIDYWIIKINKNIIKYDNTFCEKVKILYYLKMLVYDKYKYNVYDIIIKNNRIYFESDVDERWCNNFEDWHFNNNFYFTIELNNNKYYIYNHCKTCKIKELIDMSISKLFRFLV